MEAEELIARLREAGYAHDRQTLTKRKLAPHLKPENKVLWDALLRVAAPDRRGKTDPDSHVQAGPGESEQLQDQLARNKRLREMVRMQQERVQTRAHEIMVAEAQVAQLQQPCNTMRTQVLLLNAAKAREEKLLPGLQRITESLVLLVQVAKKRAEGSVPGPDIQHLQHVCGELKRNLKNQADAWLAMQPDDDVSSSRNSNTAAGPLLSVPTPMPPEDILALQSLHPQRLMTLAAQVVQEAITCAQRAHQPTGVGPPDPTANSQQGTGDEPHTSTHTPHEVIRQLQQTHVSKYVSTERLHTEQEQWQAEVSSLSTQAQDILQWPYNRHKVEEARYTAEIAEWRGAVSALRHACDQCGEAQRALNDLWQRTGASSLRQRLLNRLIMQLLTERKVNKDRWTVEEQEHQTWAGQHFPQACLLLRDHTHGNIDRPMREAELACETHKSCSQTLTEATETLTGTARNGLTHTLDGHTQRDRQWDTQQQQLAAAPAPALQLFQQALPGMAAAAPARAGGAVGPRGTPPRSSRAAGSGQVAMSQGAGQVVSAMRVLCGTDVLGPLRCPAGLLITFSDHMAQLRCLRMWLEAAQPWIDSMQQQTKRQADQQHKMHQMVTAARALDRGDRCKHLNQWQDRMRSMLKYASTSIKHHLEDMKTLPAVTLLPDVQYGGLNATEWLTAIQELHAAITETEQLAKARQRQ